MFALNSTQFVNRSKKGSYRLVERNVLKISSRCFEAPSMISWQVMNREFTRMSPKVNSSWMYGCFKMSQIQQKLLAHKTLLSKWSPIFSGKLDMSVVFQEIRKINRRRRITLHHDNVSSHTSAQTAAFLSTQNIRLMSHPPYSPDLAPNDFSFIPVRKK